MKSNTMNIYRGFPRTFKDLPGQFQDRLQFGVQRELIDLCRLTSLNGQRARVLFNAGIDSIAILANTNVADVEILLGNCAPFERYHKHITCVSTFRRERGQTGILLPKLF